MSSRMKRECGECRALANTGCTLGYKTKSYYFLHVEFFKPVEKCPKPKTYTAWLGEMGNYVEKNQ